MVPGGVDGGVKALKAILADAKQRLAVDDSRVYLVGAGPAASEVFYAISRSPDLWTAAVAVEGNPAAAVNSNRLFAANTQATPLLWAAPPAATAPLQQKLRAAGFHFETLPTPDAGPIQQWLGSRRREPYPAAIDCETGHPAFARCFWIEMIRFDTTKRNDVLKSTRVPPGSGASLALGGFGFDPAASGPGIAVVWLPDKYDGSLQLGDRIVAVGGTKISDAADYVRHMEDMKEERPVAVLVERGKERLRLETRIVLANREETITARVQATYLPGQKEILLISRSVAQMRVRVPAEWTPVAISWNGADVVKAESAGCWLLDASKEPLSAAPCSGP